MRSKEMSGIYRDWDRPPEDNSFPRAERRTPESDLERLRCWPSAAGRRHRGDTNRAGTKSLELLELEGSILAPRPRRRSSASRRNARALAKRDFRIDRSRPSPRHPSGSAELIIIAMSRP